MAEVRPAECDITAPKLVLVISPKGPAHFLAFVAQCLLTAAGALTANEGAVSSPDRYQAAFDTDQGQFLVEVQQKYAPLGAWRFFNLVRAGFYTDVKAFRAVDQFMVQFGISGDPAVSRLYVNASILDDPRGESNPRGESI
jgi:hypothetical protein